jgi:hypothetical protein
MDNAIDYHAAAESNHITIHHTLDIHSSTERGEVSANDLLRIYNNPTTKEWAFTIRCTLAHTTIYLCTGSLSGCRCELYRKIFKFAN